MNRSRMLQRVLAGKFTPLNLFSNNEQGAWYDPSDLSTLFQDDAGTNPVTTDGQPVGLMLDKSGNGHHVTQPTESVKPIYKTLNGIHWIDFEKLDRLIASATPVSFIDAYLGMSGRLVATGTTDVMFGIEDGGQARHTLQKLDTDILRAVNSADNFRGVGGGDATIDFVLSSTRTDSKLISRYNSITEGSTTQSGETTIASTGNYFIGRNPNLPNNGASGRFYGGIIRIATTPITDIEPTEEYLAKKSGVTL